MYLHANLLVITPASDSRLTCSHNIIHTIHEGIKKSVVLYNFGVYFSFRSMDGVPSIIKLQAI